MLHQESALAAPITLRGHAEGSGSLLTPAGGGDGRTRTRQMRWHGLPFLGSGLALISKKGGRVGTSKARFWTLQVPALQFPPPPGSPSKPARQSGITPERGWLRPGQLCRRHTGWGQLPQGTRGGLDSVHSKYQPNRTHGQMETLGT